MEAFQQLQEQRQRQKSRWQHLGIEEQKDVAMHLKQGRWMVLSLLEGELVVEDKLNILQLMKH